MIITNVESLPQQLVDAVTNNHTYTPKQYSVTALLKGIGQVILERRHNDEIVEDASTRIWSLFGTCMHQVLENAQELPEQLKEEKFSIPLNNGYRLSGIFDLYDANTETITDWKTTTVYRGKKDKAGNRPVDEYRQQILVYCWMMRMIGFKASHGEAVVLYRDWRKGELLREPNAYPASNIETIHWDFSEQDFTNIEKWIYERFDEIARCEQLSDDLLPICTPEERWHKEDTYAVMKKGRKTAVRVLKTQGDAQAYIDNNMLDDKHYIEKREGADNRCDNYCNVNKWCPYYQSKHACANNKQELETVEQ